MTNDHQEAEIVNGLKTGSDKAYEYLYKHYYKILCTVALECVHDTIASEMIVSDVIFAIWKNRETLDIHSSLRNYLIRSVKNRCLNYLAQSDRQQALRNDISKNMEIEQAINESSSENPLTQLIEKELDTKINASIEALPEKTHKIFCMSRYDNMKYEEIAMNTGVTVDVVKYHIKVALSQLREALKDYL